MNEESPFPLGRGVSIAISTKLTTNIDIPRILYRIQTEGFNVIRERNPGYLRFKLVGKPRSNSYCGVHGYLDNNANDYGHYYFYIDCKRLFDKYGKCPIILSAPKNLNQLDFLVHRMHWLTTKEAYLTSRFYNHSLWIDSYD